MRKVYDENPVKVMRGPYYNADVEVEFAACSSVEEAEMLIATLVEWADPVGVEEGCYGIDAQKLYRLDFQRPFRNETNF